MWSGLLAGCVLLLPQDTASPASFPVHVDARVELVTLVFRLAGAEEFDMAPSRSAYGKEVEEWFGLAREHPVIALAQALRAEHGIGFNAVPDLAMHLTPPPGLALRVPLEPFPERLDPRWKGADVAGFLAELRAFAEETDFGGFLSAHEALYRETERRLGAEIDRAGVPAWARAYFGAAPAHVFAVPGMLCGGGNYGCSVRLPDGGLEQCPVLGVSSWDAAGIPVFGSGDVPLIAHEFTHAFTNPLVDAAWERLGSPMKTLWATQRDALARQAYGDARSTAYETFVRACVVRFVHAHGGPEAAEVQAKEEASRGFTWVPALAARLAEYEAAREQYPDLSAFVPRLVECLEQSARAVAEVR